MEKNIKERVSQIVNDKNVKEKLTQFFQEKIVNRKAMFTLLQVLQRLC